MLQCLLLAVFWLDVAGRPKHRNQYHPHSMNHIQKNIHQRQTKPPQMQQKAMSGTKDQFDILSQTSTKVMDLYNDRGYQAYLVNSGQASISTSEMDSFDAYLSSEFDICYQQLKNIQIKAMLRKRHFLHIRSHNLMSNNVETSTPKFILPQSVLQVTLRPRVLLAVETTAQAKLSQQQLKNTRCDVRS